MPSIVVSNFIINLGFEQKCIDIIMRLIRALLIIYIIYLTNFHEKLEINQFLSEEIARIYREKEKHCGINQSNFKFS